jgi:hypothetical protein
MHLGAGRDQVEDNLLRVLAGRGADDGDPVRLEGPDRPVDARLVR